MELINDLLSKEDGLVGLRPNSKYSICKIGTPVRYNELLDTAEIFDWEKLNGFNLLDFHLGNAKKEYTTINNFNETESSWALGLGIKGKISYNMLSVESAYTFSKAKANLKSNITESTYMLYKFDDAFIKLNYGAANLDKIVASLKEPVAKIYWKIVLESSSYAEKLSAYKELLDDYGTGCIVRLNLISYSAAQVECESNSTSEKIKNEHQGTLGATFGTSATIAATVSYLENSSEKNKKLSFTASQDTYPLNSPTDIWVTDLIVNAIDKIQKKEWKEVKEPTVIPDKPKFPDYPKLEPKKSEEQTFTILNDKFKSLDKDKKPYLGLKMYNIAQKELIYATESEKQKDIATANADIEKSLNRLKGSDKQALSSIKINASIIKSTDVSLPYLFVQAVVNQKVQVNFDEIFTEIKTKFANFIESFTDEAAINKFVDELKGTETINVNCYANILISYQDEIELSKENLIKAKQLYNKTKKVHLLSGNTDTEIPVTEAQYQDSALELQMKNDCLVCENLEDYKLKLKEIKSNFYTQKIIEDILNIELNIK